MDNWRVYGHNFSMQKGHSPCLIVTCDDISPIGVVNADVVEEALVELVDSKSEAVVRLVEDFV